MADDIIHNNFSFRNARLHHHPNCPLHHNSSNHPHLCRRSSNHPHYYCNHNHNRRIRRTISRTSLLPKMNHLLTILILLLISPHQFMVSSDQSTPNDLPSKSTSDPRVITYPGDLNIALIIDAHENINSINQKGSTSGPLGKSSTSYHMPLSMSFSSVNFNTSSAPSSTGPQDCSSKINSDGVLKGMAAIWAAHQVNIRKGKGDNSIKIGVSVYDSCSSSQVIQRQSVRLLASSIFHPSITTAYASPSGGGSGGGNNILLPLKACSREALKLQPIIFGVVMDTDSEETATPALTLLDSFSVPVVTTSAINYDWMTTLPNATMNSSVFSVAPSLEYISKGVVALLRRLNWSSATLVISDQVPPAYSTVFEDIARKVHFNVIPTDDKRRQTESSTINRTGNSRRQQRNSGDNIGRHSNFSSADAVKNTLLFLSTRESLSLISSLRMHHQSVNLPGSDRYNWILVTDTDITDKVKAILASKSNNTVSSCHMKAMFFFVPQTNVPTKEFNRYFEHEVSTFASNSVHPLIAQFSKQFIEPSDKDTSDKDKAAQRKKLVITSSEGLSLTMEAVWTLSTALKKMEMELCTPLNLTKEACIDKIKSNNLKESIAYNTKGMSYDKISGLGISSLEGFPIKFNNRNILQTTKYSLKIITPLCKIFDAGSFTEDMGLSVNEVIFNTLRIEAEPSSPLRSSPLVPTLNISSILAGNPTTSSMTTGTTPSPTPVYFSPSTISPNGQPVTPSGQPVTPKTVLFVGDTRVRSSRGSTNVSNSVSTPSTSSNFMTSFVEDADDEDEDDDDHNTLDHISHPRNVDNQMTPSTDDEINKLSGSRNGGLPSGRSVPLKENNIPGHTETMRGPQSNGQSSTTNSKRFRHLSSRSGGSLTSWLGKGWSFVLLGTAVVGSLITLYTFTFLLMKSCEGSLGQGCRQSMIGLNLLSIMMLFLGSIIYLFEPTPVLCTIRRSIHNLALVLLFGCLLIKAMFLRAQKTIGLGGQVNVTNSMLTLAFVLGIQISVEVQDWKAMSEWTSSSIITYSSYSTCNPGTHDYLVNQMYLLLLFSILLLYSWSSRNEPLTSNEGANLFTATALISPVLATSVILSEYFVYEPTMKIPGVGMSDSSSPLDDLPRIYSSNRDLISSASMISIGYIVLGCVFLPILYTIHKYGSLMSAKVMSNYTDSSMSTAFTGMMRSHIAPHLSHINPGNMGGHNLSANHPHTDGRPILDNISTASTNSDSNNDSYLAVSKHPGSRLLGHRHHGPHNLISKAGVKKKKSRSPEGGAVTGLKHRLLMVGTRGQNGVGHHRDQMIFSPSTNSYTFACNSPNCNFRLQPKSGSPRSTNGHHQISPTSHHNHHHQVNGHHNHDHPHHQQRLYSSHPTGSSYHPGGNGHQFTTPTKEGGLTSKFSLFSRSDGPSNSRFASLISSGHVHQVGTNATGVSGRMGTTGTAYSRLNPLFETTEGSFRSAYP